MMDDKPVTRQFNYMHRTTGYNKAMIDEFKVSKSPPKSNVLMGKELMQVETNVSYTENDAAQDKQRQYSFL